MTSSGPPPGSGTALVEVTGVDKSFGTTRALRGVDLSLRAGQCLGLVGRNGAGKSTLVSILSGLSEPDAGTVRFGGEPARGSATSGAGASGSPPSSSTR